MTFAERPTKRRRTREPVLPPPRDPDAATVIPEEVAASMLDRANARILQSVGYTGATRVAQESLRSLAENCKDSLSCTLFSSLFRPSRNKPHLSGRRGHYQC